MIKGVDISNNNGNVDISNLRNEGYTFLIAKATEGQSFTDSYYVSNIQTAKQNNMLTGAYHFARFTTVDEALAEASHFKSVVSQELPNFVVLDIEYEGATGNLTEATDIFMSSIAELGLPILFYSYADFIKEHFDTKVQQYNLWIADYNVSSPDIYCWSEYDIWQYSENENGLDANIMSDEFYNLLTQKNASVQEEKKVKNLVVVGNATDKRAAEYLADKLQCPVIDATLPFDYSVVEDGGVIGVGGTPTTNGIAGWSSYVKTVIAGTDRYDTCQKVLEHIKTI